MLISGEKKNILTLVLTEKKILNETKNHTPPPLLQVKWSVPYALKELRHLINDIKLDIVLTINKPLTKTSRAVARGKV